jgi:hypothetical protein
VAGGEWGKADGTNKKLVTDTQNNKGGFSSFEWGQPAYPKDFPQANSLVFTKDQTFDAGLNEAFSIGELTYFNGSVEVKTVPDYVPLKIDLDFGTGPGKSPVFEYDLNLNTTNDNGVLNLDAMSDFVFFPDSFSPKEFKYDGKDYTLELMGFSKDGGETIESQFRVREQELDSAELFAKITEAPKKTPPGDTDSSIDDAETLKPRDDADGEIGFTEGGVRDNVDYYEFNVKDYSQVTITLDQLERNANLDILNADGRTVLFQSRELGGKRERIVEEFTPGTYYARVYPETYDDGTPYNLKVTTSTIKDEKDSLKSANDLGVLGWETSLEDKVGAGKGKRRDQADWYKFTLDEQKDLILTLDGMRGGNANVELFDSSEVLIDTGDQPGTKAERIVQRELAAGDYYVKVTPGASKDKPVYNLQLSALEVDANDDGSEPGIDLGVLLPDRKPLKSPRRTQIGGTEKGRRDTVDYYKFSLGADSDVQVNIGGMRKAGVEATLFRWEGGEMTDEVGEFSKKGKTGIVIEESNLEAGEYVLALEVGTVKGQTSYNFNIVAQPEYVDDYYPRFENALEVGDITAYTPGDKFEHKNRVGQKFAGGDRDQADWFTFELTEEKDVSVKLLNNRGGADVRLYTGNEPGITADSQKDGRNESIDVQTLEAGKYYVEVLPGRGGSGNGSYRLELGLVENGPDIETIEIGNLSELTKYQKRERIGEVIGGTKNTQDWYEFTINGDQEVEITVNGLSDNADLRLEKEARGGTQLIGGVLEEGENSEKVTYSLDEGNYIAKVKPRGTAQSGYQFAARVVGDGSEDPNGEPPTRVTEIDDPSEYSTSDSVGSRESYGRDQNDYYEFTLDATQEVSLTVDADKPLTLQLLEENEAPVDSFPNVTDKTYTTELDAGTYYINVQAGSRTANYELNLSAGDAEGDPDRGPDGTEWVNEVGDLTDAEYAPGKDSVGFVESYGPDTADWYEFSVTENSEFNLNVSGLKEAVNVRLRDGNGSVLSNEQGKGDILLDYDLNRAGTYYVEIASRGKGTAYDLNMSASTGDGDPDDTFDKAKANDPLTNPVDVSDRVGGKGDRRDIFQFSPESTGLATVSIDTKGGGAEVALYDSSEFRVDGTSGGGSINPFLQAGQDYFLEVTPTGSSTSFYDLTVV